MNKVKFIKPVEFASSLTATDLHADADSLKKLTAGSSGSTPDQLWFIGEWTANASYRGVSVTYNVVDTEGNFNGILTLRVRNTNSATVTQSGYILSWIAANKTPPKATLTAEVKSDCVVYRLYITYESTYRTLALTKLFDDTNAVYTEKNTQVSAVSGSEIVTAEFVKAERATADATGNNIEGTYETKTAAADKLNTAKSYADSAAQKVKNDLLNGAGAAYDSLKELGDLIVDNTDAIQVLEDVAATKLPLSGGNLTGTLGIGNKYELPPVYDYGNGCLIEIGPSANNTMVAIHIVGNSYVFGSLPINSIFQFYDYGSSTLMMQAGVNFGYGLDKMIAYRHNGKLYAYIKQKEDYQTLSFTLLTNKADLSPTIANSAAHNEEECTDLITITPVNYYTAAEIDNKVNAKSAKTHTHTVTHKPAGTVSTPTITVTPNTATVNSITAVGTLPALSHTDIGASKISSWSAGTSPSASLTGGGASLTATVSNGPNRCITLEHSHSNPTLTFSAGTLPNLSYTNVTASKVTSWSAGTLPTKGDNTTVVTSIKSATSTQPTFTGTEATLTTSVANS